MGAIHTPPPSWLLLATISRYEQALDWSRRQAVDAWGPVALTSPRFDFSDTAYYEPTMGPGLLKEFLLFERPFDAERLPDIKRQTNAWEEEYAALGGHAEARPLNLDPGYLTMAKLVLASTKDHAHRIYLRDGIFAEVTLYFMQGAWRAREWTFPDYRRQDYQQFLLTARQWLRERVRHK